MGQPLCGLAAGFQSRLRLLLVCLMARDFPLVMCPHAGQASILVIGGYDLAKIPDLGYGTSEAGCENSLAAPPCGSRHS